MPLPRLDYSKIDPWIKKHPKENYDAFKKANPKIVVSNWTYRKRRAKILGLPMAPSMKDDYRGGSGNSSERRTRSVYTTLYSESIQELKNKNGIEVLSEFLNVMNKTFKLHLELAQIELIGSGVTQLEVRRYSR